MHVRLSTQAYKKEMACWRVLPGTWNRSIAAPVGMQSAVGELTEKDGGVAEVVTYAGETLPLITPVLHDNRLTW